MTETKNFQWLLVPSFESLFQGVNYEVTMSCALMANYYISWRLQNIVTSSKYINIQRSWKVRVTSCYSILMTSHYFEVSKIQSNKPLMDSSRGLSQKICEIFAKNLRNICEKFAKYSRKIRGKFAKNSRKIKICKIFAKNL